MTEYSPQWKEKVRPGINAIRDMEYFREMYPQSIKALQKYVTDQCDSMDYTGSPIYDEYPEPLMIEQACTAVCRKILESWNTDEYPESGWPEEEESENAETGETQVEMMQRRPGGPPPGKPPHGGPPPWGPPPGKPPHGGPPPWGPPPWGPPPGGPPPWGPPPWGPPPGKPPHNSWLSDIVKILFMNEIQRRRCRTGFC